MDVWFDCRAITFQRSRVLKMQQDVVLQQKDEKRRQPSSFVKIQDGENVFLCARVTSNLFPFPSIFFFLFPIIPANNYAPLL